MENVRKKRIFAPISDKKQRILVRNTFALCLLLALFSFSGNTVGPWATTTTRHAFHSDLAEQAWVDSVFQSMTFEERIGQLVMLRAHSDKGFAYEQAVAAQITKYKVGGLCFFQGTAERQAELTNQYQTLVQVPMLVAIDGEWGLGMRLKETISYPRQLTLGAIEDHKVVYQLGREIGWQCKRIGIHVNFAPVADINNNAANPVINDRSFGEDRENVTQKSIQYALGMQSHGVLACAKHFPGHGDTDIDSHEALPILNHSTYRLDSLELYPFRQMTAAGVGSMMVAHLNIPSVDNRKNRPATLSDRLVYRLLRKSIGFEGVIFTDAMEMKGITKHFKPGEADVAAIKAGNDVVLLPENVDACFTALYKAAKTGELELEQVHASVRRVLTAKYRCGLHQYQPVQIAGIAADINRPEAVLLKRDLYRSALTLVRDGGDQIPVQVLDNKRFASLAIGADSETAFQQSLALYAPVSALVAPKEISVERQKTLLDSLKGHDRVFVSLHDMSRKPATNFGLSKTAIQFVHELAEVVPVTLVVFGNPYALKNFDRVGSVIQAFDEDRHCQEVTAQAIFGAHDITGVLPITASASAVFGQGIKRMSADHRIAYDLPESQGLSTQVLQGIDTIMQTMTGTGAAPGGQILIARNGTVVWHKAYGFHDYTRVTPVSLNDIYDLASVTKVASTTLAVMSADEQGLVQTEMPMSTYVPGLQNTDKSHLRVDEMLAHHAGLKAWIPFYRATLEPSGFPNAQYYRSIPDDQFSVRVSSNLWMDRNYVDSIWQQIYTSELRPVKAYKYSDLGLYLSKQMLENVTQEPIDQYNQQRVYGPLGAWHTQFNPYLRADQFQAVPTENDRYFRHGEIDGYVHDMGAAMLGGVSGHAGLFSNANDLAKVFQMLLNGGSYYNQQFFKPETLKKYTTRYPGCTRRGLGFDMKELNYQAQQNTGKLAPESTFGHLGFTGTCAWADPQNKIVVIVLTNRTYPTMDNNKFISEDYRPRIQDIVYQALAAGVRAAP